MKWRHHIWIFCCIGLFVSNNRLSAQHAFSLESYYNWTNKKTFYKAGGDTMLYYRTTKTDDLQSGFQYRYLYHLFSVGSQVGFTAGKLRHWSLSVGAHPLESFDGFFIQSGLTIKPALGFNIAVGADFNMNDDETLKLSPVLRYSLLTEGKKGTIGSESWNIFEIGISLRFVFDDED